jgi:hypothetical protein
MLKLIDRQRMFKLTPDMADFSLLGGCLLGVVFVKIAEIAQIIRLLFSTVKDVH